MKTLTQLLTEFREESPNGATALTAYYEDGTIASVVTALGYTGKKAGGEAAQVVCAAHADFLHFLQKEYA